MIACFYEFDNDDRARRPLRVIRNLYVIPYAEPLSVMIDIDLIHHKPLCFDIKYGMNYPLYTVLWQFSGITFKRINPL